MENPGVPATQENRTGSCNAGKPDRFLLDDNRRTMLLRIHHAAIICSDYEVSKRFYTQVLGLPVLAEHWRAERSSWKLDLALPDGSQIVLFSFEGRPARPSYPEARGLRHLAFVVADVALAMVGHLGFVGERKINGTERKRGGNYLYGAFGRDFTTADGERVMVMAISPKMWSGLLAATGLKDALAQLGGSLDLDLGQEGARYTARREIAGLLAGYIGALPLAALAKAFDAEGVCWGRYQKMVDLIDHDPDCSPANPIYHLVEQPDIGTYPVAGQPMHFGAVARNPARRAPRLGEHTDAILADLLGLSSGEIGKLHDLGIVAGPTR